MKSEEREYWEYQILLRSSGELSLERCEVLEQILVNDNELAEYSRFVEQDMAGIARAPRDFAAEVIADISGTEDVVTPRRFGGFWLGAAAAALAMGGLAVLLIKSHESPHITAESGLADVSPAMERHTIYFTSRGNELESMLKEARQILQRSRFAN